ncbi:YccF domain-containing protein [Corynebacterium sp. HMSC29G08]|uniref:YccF domain-containing protein n=1 Tax=Corynebacterium sp. HMSC29G08 TaxID=1581069 RepID=UPI001AEF750B|nr:YccF domain-containing protein [Corynebacterium sp. HMSC29G08]
MRFILNVIWLFTAGIWLFIGYILAGVVACVLVVTIPFGLASFRIAGYVIWPFGREVIQGNVGALGMLGNVIWFIVAGLWLSIGHIVTAAAQAVTIIGLPLAWANLKLIPVTCFPFGARVVDSNDDRSRYTPVVG